MICISEVPLSDQEVHPIFKSQETDLCHCTTMESNILPLYRIIKGLSILFVYFNKEEGCCLLPLWIYSSVCIHTSLRTVSHFSTPNSLECSEYAFWILTKKTETSLLWEIFLRTISDLNRIGGTDGHHIPLALTSGYQLQPSASHNFPQFSGSFPSLVELFTDSAAHLIKQVDYEVLRTEDETH